VTADIASVSTALPRDGADGPGVAGRYHYEVVRRALDVIDAEGAPLTLEALAARVGLSPAHLQRVFSRWAGVSPKRYQQFLALDHAKTLLRERATTLDTAAEIGLSGTGRLHDLFVTWEAMAPGDFARGGAGLTIRWGWIDSPFGPALVMATERGICGIGFAAEIGAEATMADLQGRWPAADYRDDAAAVAALAASAFARAGTNAPAPRLHLIGAPFQIKVWEALLAIPPGHVSTYSSIAAAIGAPKASRAVGSAVGRNPVGWLIPCHRALRKSGGLGGYHWGLPVKRAMLAEESARAEAGAEAAHPPPA
jgi:AraC family transcriptional regulator of adaptative response/methylated-DNA-[protein]-cysteine methyltransferase